MCIRAGVKNSEIDDSFIADLQMHISAYYEENKEQWKKTTTITYMLASVNRDPKKSLPPITKLYPEIWDGEIEEDELVARARARQTQK